ncbi:MAG: hypothetical protein JXD23_00840 [Spirochaetales bacterium]|nr:hypothetical protein [Spirochaetales bacterium]
MMKMMGMKGGMKARFSGLAFSGNAFHFVLSGNLSVIISFILSKLMGEEDQMNAVNIAAGVVHDVPEDLRKALAAAPPPGCWPCGTN